MATISFAAHKMELKKHHHFAMVVGGGCFFDSFIPSFFHSLSFSIYSFDSNFIYSRLLVSSTHFRICLFYNRHFRFIELFFIISSSLFGISDLLFRFLLRNGCPSKILDRITRKLNQNHVCNVFDMSYYYYSVNYG